MTKVAQLRTLIVTMSQEAVNEFKFRMTVADRAAFKQLAMRMHRRYVTKRKSTSEKVYTWLWKNLERSPEYDRIVQLLNQVCTMEKSWGKYVTISHMKIDSSNCRISAVAHGSLLEDIGSIEFIPVMLAEISLTIKTNENLNFIA